MMDIEKLIERLYKHHTDWGEGRTQNFFEVCLDCKESATALSTLQAENERLRDAIKPNCIGCHHIHPDNGNCTAVGGFCTAVPAAHCPLIPELRDENEQLRSDLRRLQTERDTLLAANQSLLAEREQLTAERDAAVKKYEAEKEDFLDYALSGTQNAAPFCTNRHPDCVDKRGWCVPVKCHGFSRDKED